MSEARPARSGPGWRSLPAGPATIQTALPDGSYELATVTAVQAYEQLRAVGDPKNAPDVTPAPLRITKVTLGTASFGTDRGMLTLPAWRSEAAAREIPLVEIYPGQRAFSFRSTNLTHGRLVGYGADGLPVAVYTGELRGPERQSGPRS